MNKIIVSAVALGLLAGTAWAGKTVNNYYGDEVTNNTYITNVDADNMKLRVATGALSSVELNPDHEGWSVGVGASLQGDTNAYAIGVMYGEEFKRSKYIKNMGINLKAYNAEGQDANGVGVGLTIGF